MSIINDNINRDYNYYSNIVANGEYSILDADATTYIVLGNKNNIIELPYCIALNKVIVTGQRTDTSQIECYVYGYNLSGIMLSGISYINNQYTFAKDDSYTEIFVNKIILHNNNPAIPSEPAE